MFIPAFLPLLPASHLTELEVLSAKGAQVLWLCFHPSHNPFSPSQFCLLSSLSLQASQLGVYKAFVDNYKVALETAEKCSQSNN